VHLAYTITQVEVGFIDAREQQAAVSSPALKIVKRHEDDRYPASLDTPKNVQEVFHALRPVVESPYHKRLAQQDPQQCKDF
jgi:hypothetical protein